MQTYLTLTPANTPATWGLSTADLQARHPHTSFPQPLTAADVAGLGYLPVQPTPQPVHDPRTHVCTEAAPVPSAADTADAPAPAQWQQAWTLTPRPTAEAAQLQATHAQQQAAYARAHRNALLAGTDWTQLPDVQATMSAAQRTAYTDYRQALRDWTSHSGYPSMSSLPQLAQINPSEP
jgi:hypothetical protein